LKGFRALTEEVIASFDKDGDGYLNEQEFLDLYNDFLSSIW
jgi:Ca2+-binding EF-hand superfamily protein